MEFVEEMIATNANGEPDLTTGTSEEISASFSIDVEWEKTLKDLGIFTPQRLMKANDRQVNEPTLVEGLLRSKTTNLLVGDSNLGKTPLGIQLGLSIAAGRPFLNRTVQQGRVLYCDAEMGLSLFWEVTQNIGKFLELDTLPSDFLTWSPNWDDRQTAGERLARWSDKLLRRVESVKPVLVIVDPLRMFWPNVETKNDEAAVFIKSLKELTRKVGCSWVIMHHRRKTNNLVAAPLLHEDPHRWFEEAAGARAIVNQTDSRIGIVPHPGQADLLVGGFIRGTGAFSPLDLVRVAGDDGTPIGYRVLTGIEHLSSEQRAAYDKLPTKFRFKEIHTALGGKSDSNASNFAKKCVSLEILKKEGKHYVKASPPPMEDMELME